MVGTPPPFWPWESDVTCPAIRVQLLSTVGLLLRRTGGFNHLEGSLNSSTHTGGHHVVDFFSDAALAVSVSGMDLRRGGDVICVRLRPRLCHSTAELALRETSATPCGTGYGDTLSPSFLGPLVDPDSPLWLSFIPP